MQYCLATLEGHIWLLDEMENESILHGLASYFYLKSQKDLELILSKIKINLLIDSGAHTFQHQGDKVNYDDYVRKYIEFIKANTDNPKIEGFFELDVDNVLGYEKVKEYRKMLEEVSDKIIPVWHCNRGIQDYVDMCKEYTGKKISITGFANGDMSSDSQYNYFINTAHKYGCKVHILGCTRFKLIKDLNLSIYDSFDSSTWKQGAIYGEVQLPLNDKTLYRMKAFHGLKNYDGQMMTVLNMYNALKMQEMLENEDNSIYYKKETKK